MPNSDNYKDNISDNDPNSNVKVIYKIWLIIIVIVRITV